MYLIANNYTSISYRQVIHVDSCRGLASLELERSSEEGLSGSGGSELAAYVHLRWLSRLLCSALRYVVETLRTPAGVCSLPLVIEFPDEGLTHSLYIHNKPLTARQLCSCLPAMLLDSTFRWMTPRYYYLLCSIWAVLDSNWAALLVTAP